MPKTQTVERAFFRCLRFFRFKFSPLTRSMIMLVEAGFPRAHGDLDFLVPIALDTDPPTKRACCGHVFQQAGAPFKGDDDFEFAALSNCSVMNSSLKLPSGRTTVAVGFNPAAVAAVIAFLADAG